MIHSSPDHSCFLAIAARLSARGFGGVAPNPCVGCVIVSADGRIVGEGYHRRYGGPHAEVMALQHAGSSARGGTAFVTLEPCNHHGRTPPCTDALIQAGIKRVVYARRDPHHDAQGGAERLRAAGIDAELDESCRPAVRASDPFIYRETTGLPWLLAKWAQTIDGRIATRSGASQWISNERSRRFVHRIRGRVDAILTGIGTILADDPLLTARNVRCRRIARRVVVDHHLATPLNARIIQTAHEVPTTIITSQSVLNDSSLKQQEFHRHNVDVIAVAEQQDRLDLTEGLRQLSARYDVTNVLVESGGGLLGELFTRGLINEAMVFIAPMVFGDENAQPCIRGHRVEAVADGIRFELIGSYRRGDDILLRYRTGDVRP